MRYVAAYLLAVLGGNNEPSAKDIKKILSSVGIDADDSCVNKVIDELKGKNIEELIIGIAIKNLAFLILKDAGFGSIDLIVKWRFQPGVGFG